MNKQILSKSAAAGCLLALSNATMAANFVVRDIQVNGLQRIAPSTVISYLPVQVGQTFDDRQSASIIRALFETGLFEDVQLSRNGDVLLISVTERAAIGEINVQGNRVIKTEQLLQALKNANIGTGDTLNRAALLRIQRQLEEQYVAQGYYGAKINSQIQPLDRNRVALNINIQEGGIARIQQVRITGNRAFPEKTLLDLMDSGKRGALALPFLSKRDQYGRQKLIGDLDTITSFYRDRGYLNFEIVSNQVTLTPDKHGVFINIAVKEGEQFQVGTVNIAGSHRLSQQQINQAIVLREGQVFSQKNLEETRKNLRNTLGEEGYAFAKINARPQIDNINKRVGITLNIEPGRRTYVRRIDIRGNNRTRDEVYRRELRQFESSWFSRKLIERSRIRLQRLPYVESVNIATDPVAGTQDQVDLRVVIKERSSNQFSIGAGFSQSRGLLLSLKLQQDNFMGTGKQVNLDLDNSSANRNFRISYNNPYYTPDGVSRGFSLFYNEFDADEDDISDFASDRAGGSINYGIPLSEHASARFSFGVEQRDITLGSSPAQHIQEFVDQNGSEYLQFPAQLSYVYDTRNRSVFPSSGQRHRASLEVQIPGSDLEFQKVSYQGTYYKALTDNVTFRLQGRVATGWSSDDNDELPFFEKYYAGGLRSVRGFERNSLGPRDSNGDAKGGDLLLTGSAQVIFPVPFASDVKGMRMSAFVDAGNVFEDPDSFDAGELRYSAGIGLIWLTPIGFPIEISYATALNAEDGDEEQKLQFSIGNSF